jgi:hypothetical protein
MWDGSARRARSGWMKPSGPKGQKFSGAPSPLGLTDLPARPFAARPLFVGSPKTSEAPDRELANVFGTVVLGPVNGGAEPDQADQPAPPELEGAG